MGRLVGIDGRAIVHREEHHRRPTTVSLTANTPAGPTPAVIVLCARWCARAIQVLDIPGLATSPPPPGSVPVTETVR